ncbi:unnamed protein product [Symbiodinium sp. CCMP2592]|nr:unnamed protein product [Symbiodinium sp. CCMP2592]
MQHPAQHKPKRGGRRERAKMKQSRQEGLIGAGTQIDKLKQRDTDGDISFDVRHCKCGQVHSSSVEDPDHGENSCVLDSLAHSAKMGSMRVTPLCFAGTPYLNMFSKAAMSVYDLSHFQVKDAIAHLLRKDEDLWEIATRNGTAYKKQCTLTRLPAFYVNGPHSHGTLSPTDLLKLQRDVAQGKALKGEVELRWFLYLTGLNVVIHRPGGCVLIAGEGKDDDEHHIFITGGHCYFVKPSPFVDRHAAELTRMKDAAKKIRDDLEIKERELKEDEAYARKVVQELFLAGPFQLIAMMSDAAASLDICRSMEVRSNARAQLAAIIIKSLEARDMADEQLSSLAASVGVHGVRLAQEKESESSLNAWHTFIGHTCAHACTGAWALLFAVSRQLQGALSTEGHGYGTLAHDCCVLAQAAKWSSLALVFASLSMMWYKGIVHSWGRVHTMTIMQRVSDTSLNMWGLSPPPSERRLWRFRPLLLPALHLASIPALCLLVRRLSILSTWDALNEALCSFGEFCADFQNAITSGLAALKSNLEILVLKSPVLLREVATHGDKILVLDQYDRIAHSSLRRWAGTLGTRLAGSIVGLSGSDQLRRWRDRTGSQMMDRELKSRNQTSVLRRIGEVWHCSNCKHFAMQAKAEVHSSITSDFTSKVDSRRDSRSFLIFYRRLRSYTGTEADGPLTPRERTWIQEVGDRLWLEFLELTMEEDGGVEERGHGSGPSFVPEPRGNRAVESEGEGSNDATSLFQGWGGALALSLPAHVIPPSTVLAEPPQFLRLVHRRLREMCRTSGHHVAGFMRAFRHLTNRRRDRYYIVNNELILNDFHMYLDSPIDWTVALPDEEENCYQMAWWLESELWVERSDEVEEGAGWESDLVMTVRSEAVMEADGRFAWRRGEENSVKRRRTMTGDGQQQAMSSTTSTAPSSEFLNTPGWRSRTEWRRLTQHTPAVCQEQEVKDIELDEMAAWVEAELWEHRVERLIRQYGDFSDAYIQSRARLQLSRRVRMRWRLNSPAVRALAALDGGDAASQLCGCACPWRETWSTWDESWTSGGRDRDRPREGRSRGSNGAPTVTTGHMTVEDAVSMWFQTLGVRGPEDAIATTALPEGGRQDRVDIMRGLGAHEINLMQLGVVAVDDEHTEGEDNEESIYMQTNLVLRDPWTSTVEFLNSGLCGMGDDFRRERARRLRGILQPVCNQMPCAQWQLLSYGSGQLAR